MSNLYTNSDSWSLEALRAFESAVKRLAVQFQGKNAFDFDHELELTAHLMVWTRESFAVTDDLRGTSVCLARMEWPCVTRRPIDLVLWNPSKAREAYSQWGIPRGRLAKTVPLLAAVQIKRGGGTVAAWTRTKKDIDDLEAVYKAEHLQKPILYFLEYVDHGLHDIGRGSSIFREVRVKLDKWCSKAPDSRRAFVISRDKVGFAYPRKAWLIDPLPPGTTENI